MCAKLIGRLESVGIGKESVRGTAVAATYWLQWLELALDNKTTIVPNESSLARIEDSDDSVNIEEYGECTVKMKIKDKSIGLLLLAALGTVNSAVAAGETIVYEHTFTLANTNTHQSLTISHKSSNDDVRYALAMLETLKIEYVKDNYPTVECTFMSKPSASATNTVAHAAETDFLPKMFSLKKAATQSGLGAASVLTGIQSASLEIKKNLFIEYDLGSNEPAEILNQSFGITGSITVAHTDGTYSTLQNDETAQALRFDLLGTATIGVAEKQELMIDLYKVRFSNYAREMAANDIVLESIDFQAHYSIADSKMIQVVLTNLVTAY